MNDLDSLVAATRATLERIARDFSPAVFASSLAAEDMVLTDLILKAGLPIGIFSLDTGRLHPETLAVVDAVKARYDYDITLYHPNAQAVDAYVAENGLNAFYDSIEMRRSCCGIRKVEPLGRALEGRDAWLTGQRRAQGPERAALPLEETDLDRGIAKHNPLADWSDEELRRYVERHDVPVNALHARGYPSIGCEPCTRAVKAGEDARAGRWWWERGTAKECGLHLPKIVVEPVADR